MLFCQPYYIMEYSEKYKLGLNLRNDFNYEVRMKVTIDMIANKCGVSKVTVSRVIANNPNVNQKTREMILETMSQMNYRPKKLAGIIAPKQNNVIAVMAEDITRRSSIDVIRSVKRFLAAQGYFCVAMEYDPQNFQREIEILEEFCAGCIVIAGMKNTQNLISIQVQSMPITVIHWNLSWSQLDSVIENSYKCSYMMVEYLVSLGHKNIVLINSQIHASGHYDAEAGYRDAMAEYGLEVKDAYLMESDLSKKSGSMAGKAILASMPEITAAICTNSSVAYGLIHELDKAEISVPAQFSVISCGLSRVGDSDLDISAVGARYEEMGTVAAENILGRLAEKSQGGTVSKGAIKKLILDPVLYEGSTTARVPE